MTEICCKCQNCGGDSQHYAQIDRESGGGYECQECYERGVQN